MQAKPNAQHGDEPKSSFLHIRVTRQQKARWVKQAQARGMKLSAWVLEKLEPKSAKLDVWEEFAKGLKKGLKNEN